MRLRTCRPGFTLMEMMIAVGICLFMMMVLTMVFKVCTSTVRQVETRLDAYEAARNILDDMDIEISRAMQNEKGELFAIRGMAFDPASDQTYGVGDLSRTAYGLLMPQTTGVAIGTTPRFTYSRREADSVHFLRWGEQPAGVALGGVSLSAYPGACYYPRTVNSTGSDLFHGAFYSSLQRPPWYPNSATVNVASTRAWLLSDVSHIQVYCGFGGGRCNTIGPQGGTPRFQGDTMPPLTGNSASAEGTNPMAPGHEILAPKGPGVGTTIGVSSGNTLGSGEFGGNGKGGEYNLGNSIGAIDFGVEFWQANPATTGGYPTGQFQYLNDNTAVYFSPMPRAVLVTIQVCDRNKRGKVVLSRIIQIKSGTSNCIPSGVSLTAGDTLYYHPARYNRAKILGSSKGAKGVDTWLYPNQQLASDPNSNEGFIAGDDQ